MTNRDSGTAALLASTLLASALLAAPLAAQQPAAPAAPAARHGDTTIVARPPCVDAIADGMRVRAFDTGARRTRTGTALGWSVGAPRLVTARGDTVALGPAHQLSRSEGRTGRHTLAGAFLGWGAAVIATLATCDSDFSSCGEQNPLPLLGGALGAGIGSRFTRERWTRVWPAGERGCASAPA